MSLDQSGGELGDALGDRGGDGGVCVGQGVLPGGPEGEEGLGDVLKEEQVVQVASCMAHFL